VITGEHINGSEWSIRLPASMIRNCYFNQLTAEVYTKMISSTIPTIAKYMLTIMVIKIKNTTA
jgi:hypothetical protein